MRMPFIFCVRVLLKRVRDRDGEEERRQCSLSLPAAYFLCCLFQSSAALPQGRETKSEWMMLAYTAMARVVLCQLLRVISLETGSENVTHHPEIFVRNGWLVAELRGVTGWRAYISGTTSSDRVDLQQQ